MKLVSRFLNLLMLCILFCMSTFVEWGVYNLIALPAGETSTIAIVDKTVNEEGYSEKVTYFDTFTFLGDDLKQSVTREPRFAIRSWFKWDWWQNGMKWADTGLEFVIGAVVPIAAPVYEIKQIQYFYTKNNPVTTKIGNGAYTVNGLYVLQDGEFEKFDKNGTNYDVDFVLNFEEEHGTTFVYTEFTSPGFINGEYTDICTSGNIYKLVDGELVVVSGWIRYGSSDNFTSTEWKKENKSFINILMKLNKYNAVDENGNNTYTKWVVKFMDKDANKTIKTSACSLYFQFYLAIILSIWFVYQNPIVIKRNEFGEDEVSGGFRRRKRRPKEDTSDSDERPKKRPFKKRRK